MAGGAVRCLLLVSEFTEFQPMPGRPLVDPEFHSARLWREHCVPLIEPFFTRLFLYRECPHFREKVFGIQ
jgi:hypothetical protein